MANQSSQIKFSLPPKLKTHIENRSKRLGVPMAHYIRYLILSDLESQNYPVMQVSDRTEKAYRAAKAEEKAGKLIVVEDLEKYFDEL